MIDCAIPNPCCGVRCNVVSNLSRVLGISSALPMSCTDYQLQDIKPEWKNAPVLEFADGPFVVIMWDKRYKDPSDPTREYTRNHLAILRIEDGRIQGIWD